MNNLSFSGKKMNNEALALLEFGKQATFYKSQGYGFESHYGQEFFILNLFAFHAQVECADANEIKHYIHPRYSVHRENDYSKEICLVHRSFN